MAVIFTYLRAEALVSRRDLLIPLTPKENIFKESGVSSVHSVNYFLSEKEKPLVGAGNCMSGFGGKLTKRLLGKAVE